MPILIFSIAFAGVLTVAWYVVYNTSKETDNENI